MSMTSEVLRPKISALLSRHSAGGGTTGGAVDAGNNDRSGPWPPSPLHPVRRSTSRAFVVRERCDGVVRSWTEFAPCAGR